MIQAISTASGVAPSANAAVPTSRMATSPAGPTNENDWKTPTHNPTAPFLSSVAGSAATVV
ncbi:MAG: hypothetical protein ACYCPF_06190 [Streptosporangiaceae bacterium]